MLHCAPVGTGAAGDGQPARLPTRLPRDHQRAGRPLPVGASNSRRHDLPGGGGLRPSRPRCEEHPAAVEIQGERSWSLAAPPYHAAQTGTLVTN